METFCLTSKLHRKNLEEMVPKVSWLLLFIGGLAWFNLADESCIFQNHDELWCFDEALNTSEIFTRDCSATKLRFSETTQTKVREGRGQVNVYGRRQQITLFHRRRKYGQLGRQSCLHCRVISFTALKPSEWEYFMNASFYPCSSLLAHLGQNAVYGAF